MNLWHSTYISQMKIVFGTQVSWTEHFMITAIMNTWLWDTHVGDICKELAGWILN